MLDLELRLHAERRALFDCEWLALERLDGAGRSQVDDDVGAALDLETKRENDAFTRVRRVGDVFALAET